MNYYKKLKNILYRKEEGIFYFFSNTYTLGGVCMKKKYWIILLIVVLVIGGIFFYKNRVKNLKIGNNKTSQEIVDKILNISSYEVKVTINVMSNKNSNKYILVRPMKYQYPCRKWYQHSKMEYLHNIAYQVNPFLELVLKACRKQPYLCKS